VKVSNKKTQQKLIEDNSTIMPDSRMVLNDVSESVEYVIDSSENFLPNIKNIKKQNKKNTETEIISTIKHLKHIVRTTEESIDKLESFLNQIISEE
jgi:hypothetical protein